MKEKIVEDGIKITALTCEEWFESKNVGIWPRSSFINHPPNSCPVRYNFDKNEYIVYSLLRGSKLLT